VLRSADADRRRSSRPLRPRGGNTVADRPDAVASRAPVDTFRATKFYAEDGEFAVGDYTHKGHAAISKFYSDRAQRIPASHKDGIRVSMHTFVNMRVHVADERNATVYFTM
jgi:hypothetical protein